jgi:hypothetical protein
MRKAKKKHKPGGRPSRTTGRVIKLVVSILVVTLLIMGMIGRVLHFMHQHAK